MPPVCSDKRSRHCGAHRRMKTFFCTLALALCAVLLAGGLLWADVRTRTVTFEDSTPPYITHTASETDLPLPAAGEVLRRLYNGEKTLLEYLLEKAQNIT